MKITAWTHTLILSLFLCGTAFAQSEVTKAAGDGIPIEKLVATVAQKTGKQFVIDPRVNAQVTFVNQDPRNLTYAQFLTVLAVHGLVAFESEGVVSVVPEGGARQMTGPVIGREKHADAEFVTAVIELKSAHATMLVPILRPLLPQCAHLAALGDKNSLIVSDRYGNVQRIRALVEALDKGPSYKPPSDAAETSPKPDRSPGSQ